MRKQAFWMGLSIVLFGLCVWNIVQNRRLKEAVAYLTGGQGLGSEAHPFKKAVLAGQHMAMGHVGQMLAWPTGLTTMGEGSPLPVPHGDLLVLAINEMGCDACRDQETQFVRELARMSGEQTVAIVVHARNQRYVRAYIRVNGLELPVFFDAGARFFEANRITESPVLLLVNEGGGILAAHYPITDEPDLCVPFHKMCHRILGSSSEQVEASSKSRPEMK